MKVLAFLGGLLVLATVTACVPEPPEMPEAPELAVKGALVEDQYQSVIEHTFEVIAQADEALDPDLLEERVSGMALEVRAAHYVAAKEADADLEPLPSQMQAVYVSGAESFPRVMAAVSEQPASGQTPVVYMWVQPSPQDDYMLHGWARMIPGAAMPAMPSPLTGATQARLTQSTVEPSPRQAWEQYLELLREGSDSDLNDVFADDMYRERIFSARSALKKAADEADGDYLDTIQSRLDDTYVLLTADGGALVLAPLEIESSFSVKNARVSVTDESEALLDGNLKNKVTHHYSDFVVMYISGPGVEQRPRVVAADHFLVKVSND